MRKFLLVAAMGTGFFSAMAQTNPARCGIDAVRAHVATHNPSMLPAFLPANGMDATQRQAAVNEEYSEVVIPVVFHIVVTESQLAKLGGVGGLERRLSSQIDVLNEDYNAGNADASKIPEVFKSRYGNAKIKFGMARRHYITGGAFPGYQLKVLAPGVDTVYDIYSGREGSRYFCSDAKYDTPKGLAAWPTDKFLNVWVVRITENNREGVIGITTPPSFTNQGQILSRYPEEVGVVLTYGVLGRRGSPMDFFFQRELDKGRTATHEIGHFFEVDHIWGIQTGCNTDDGIDDTPIQNDANYSCPNFPKTNCDNSTGGEMFMNFMDYVDDGCMHMFTNGQVARMRSQLAPGGKSHSLTQNPDLIEWPQNVASSDWSDRLVMAPNPASEYITIYTNNNQEINEVSVRNLMGQQVKSVPLSGNTAPGLRVDLSGLSKGLYIIQCTIGDQVVSRKIMVQ